MEVDRISQIAPLSRDHVAPWPDPAKRRRKFFEEFTDSDSDESEDHSSEASDPEISAGPDSSPAPVASPEDDDRPHSFSVLA
jgi:hypothetical protein